MAGNAARCALELALLDAYGQPFGESVGRAVELATVPGLRRHAVPTKVRYGAAITAESWLNELRAAIKYRVYGFHDVKTKVGVEGQDDVRRLRWFRWILGPWVDLRLDANEAWPAAELLDRVEPLRRFSLSALEQPVPHAEVEALADLRRRLGVPVMLDESLCGYPDAGRRDQEHDGRHAQRPALEVRRDLPVAADHRPGPALGPGASARLPPRRDGHPVRARAGTSPAGSRG